MAALHASPPPPSDLSWRTKGITNLTVHIPSSIKSASGVASAPPRPSRWRTHEFWFYGLVFVAVIPLMTYSVINLSRGSHPNYPFYKHRLAGGWLFGREVDTSDAQYRGFRSNFPILCALACTHLIVTRANGALRAGSRLTNPSLDVISTAVFCIVMMLVLHGSSAFKIFAIMGTNYTITKVSHGNIWGIPVTWTFNISILIANQVFEGYRYGSLHPALAFLDQVRGFYPRWNIIFNITMLRLVSFNLDYIWAFRIRKSQGFQQVTTAANERNRTIMPHPEAVYNIWNYITYVLYPPLYIAGPIMTFNDFMWQVRHPLAVPRSRRLLYGARFLVSLLTMEVILHFIYVVAIKDAMAWSGDTPFELAMIGFWNLIIMWLKLLIPWRFFRLWALLDGIDPPENMVRCVGNNYSTLGFWRSWHRSYNLWLIRYIYIPLGGSSSGIINGIIPKVVVFTFVALWHEFAIQLLLWGWLISLFLLPELVATWLFPETQYGREPWFRHICALGGALNIVLMMSANLVGFVLGTEGTRYFVEQIVGTWRGWGFVVLALPCLYVAVQVMFEYREEEKRQGIFRKC